MMAKGNRNIITLEDAFSQFIQAICAGKVNEHECGGGGSGEGL